MKIFKFKKELGWAEIISFLALLVSVAALWISSTSNKPYIVKGSGLISATTVKSSNICYYIISIPIEFHNSSNTAVTFRRFIPSEISSVIFGKEKMLLDSPKNDYELYLVDKNVRKNDIARVKSSQIININSYQFTDKLILPGSSYKKNLILITKPYKDNKNIADSIYFSVIAEFGNGQKLPISLVTNVESFAKTSCNPKS